MSVDPTYTPGSQSPGGTMSVSGEAANMLSSFWPKSINDIRALKNVRKQLYV